MTLQHSEPDFMLQRKEGSLVTESKTKQKTKMKWDVSQAGAVTLLGTMKAVRELGAACVVGGQA